MADPTRDPRGDPCACGDTTEWHQECYAERLKVQRGPFKGKDQQWFTRAEVIALLQRNAGVGACPLGCTATENCAAIRDGCGSECVAKPFQLRTDGVIASDDQTKR